jgi:hypothetical protein
MSLSDAYSLLKNIKLDLKGMPRKNALASLASTSLTKTIRYAPALYTIMKLGRKDMPRENAPAYLASSSLTNTILVLLYSSSLMKRPNKLECLSLVSLSFMV